MKIIGRAKDIFKLSQGEYVSPGKVEGILAQCAAIGQVFIHGSSLKSCVLGVIVPDPDTLKAWCAERKIIEDSYEDLCKNAQVKKLIHTDILTVGKSKGLKSFEMVSDLKSGSLILFSFLI